ncbi:kelch-like protein 5 isoform X1 [Eurosta solidaginis]|uniref:kelch-like protein 5 isoform X1 n=1 Tax=Eurosta solidaginis TaxID=178769 RepID=UPI0035309B64
MAACNVARQRLSEVNPDGAKYFIENLLFQIYEHFVDQNLVDVTFKLTNPSSLITAHRLILSAASPYFRELFKSDDRICSLIEITNIDSDTFERLITFCYTGKTLVTIDNVDRMLKAALILQLKGAVANCADFIIENITDFTLQRAYSLEKETQCEILNEKILAYETRNFMQVTQSSEFLDFDAKKLQAIIESENLHVRCEKDVFNAVKRWYEHNASARKHQLPELIACLRLTQYNMDFIMANIHPLPGCENVALKVLSWHNYSLARSKLALKYTEKRGGQIPDEESLLALNQWTGIIYQYNKTEDLWQKWGDIKINLDRFGVIFVGENLIVVGGYRYGRRSNEVRSWNFKTKRFKQLPSMNLPRSSHCVAILNEKIYAIGGCSAKGVTLRSVEMYSVLNGWKSVSNMITPRYDACAVAFNHKIYVMGGNNESDLKSVECYDPIKNCWTQCADMNEIHNFANGTVHNGQIFVLGGDKCSAVERYDPQINKWTKICCLSKYSYQNCSISVDNQLWAVGCGGSNCVSVYDEQNNKWIAKRKIPEKGRYYCFTLPKVLLKSE